MSLVSPRADDAEETAAMTDETGFETRQIHAGQEPDPTTGARAVPIYQTTSYQFRSTEHAANLFALAEVGNVYTRIMNPTTAVFEARIAALEGAPDTAIGIPGALAVGSGQAAETFAILNIAEPGSHIVSSASLYGGTYNLFHYTLPKMGIDVSFVDDADDLEQWAKAIQPNTKALYGETIGNPRNDVFDIEGIADVAHSNDIPLILDNTVPTPWLIRPFEWGCDIVVHSATKFIGGHGTSIGGVIVDAGSFDFSSGKFPGFTEPDPSYHGLKYWEALGPGSFIIKARVQLLARHRCARLAVQLLPLPARARDAQPPRRAPQRERPACRGVPGRARRRSRACSSQDSRARRGTTASQKYSEGRGAGSVPAFIIKGGVEAGKKFVEALTLHSHVANIGDVRSLAIHPATTTHSQLSETEQVATGVDPGLVRLSVGLETIDDILADLDRGFAAAR